jgi:CBS domain containing-hemolysin-like protein
MTSVATEVVLIGAVGELVPKRIALNSPERIAARVARPMRLLSTAAGPLVSLLTLSTDVVLRLLQVRPSQEAAVSEEEVRVLIAQGTEAGVFEEAERKLVESAFELGETRVEELMTPRPLVTWLNADEPADVAWREASKSPHGYYPVCRGELDQVVGVLSLRELAQGLLAGQRPPLAGGGSGALPKRENRRWILNRALHDVNQLLDLERLADEADEGSSLTAFAFAQLGFIELRGMRREHDYGDGPRALTQPGRVGP